jgi:hypothetical protein
MQRLSKENAMNRILLALTVAASFGMTAPAFAFSFQVNLPTLTYPPHPEPDTTQGCNDLTTRADDGCATPPA